MNYIITFDHVKTVPLPTRQFCKWVNNSRTWYVWYIDDGESTGTNYYSCFNELKRFGVPEKTCRGYLKAMITDFRMHKAKLPSNVRYFVSELEFDKLATGLHKQISKGRAK